VICFHDSSLSKPVGGSYVFLIPNSKMTLSVLTTFMCCQQFYAIDTDGMDKTLFILPLELKPVLVSTVFE